jgi:hypothetical protein
MGIEPTFEAWEAPVLPLNYTRDMRLTYRDPHHYVTGLLRTSLYSALTGQRRSAPLFQSAPCRLVEPTFEAWEAPVLPLNYTRRMVGVRRLYW